MNVTGGRARQWRVVSWLAMAVVVFVALGYAVAADDGERTNAERAADLAAVVACPQCRGETVARSNAPIAEVIRLDIKRRVDAGESDDQILGFYADEYPGSVLTPPSSGFDSFVWIAPFLAAGVAAGGLGLAFARWRGAADTAGASPEDVALVHRARSAAAAHDARQARLTARLDPDAMAALEDERAFLLSSIEDLDREHDAGDLDEDDYETLRDDYTRRAAEVIRALDEERQAFASAVRPLSTRQIGLWLVGLTLAGTVVGVAIAQSSGTRLAGETATGDVRGSVLSDLNQARQLFADAERWDEATSLYDAVLERQPTNVEALTYRGWLQYRQGTPFEDVLPAWTDAVRLDAEYPDVRVFLAIGRSDTQDWEGAAAEIDAFDQIGPPDALVALVDAQGLRGKVFAEVLRARVVEGEALARVTLADLDVSAKNALAAAEVYLNESEILAAQKLYEAVTEVEPENPEALVRLAFIYTVVGQTDVAADRLARFDALDPEAIDEGLRAEADAVRAQLEA